MDRKQIETAKAPAAVGAYSQGILAGNLIFASGSLPMDPVSKAMPVDIKAQAKMALENMKAIIEAGGGSLASVVKVTIFLVDMNDFAAVNEIYAGFFTSPYPARSCVAVRALPLGAKVEMEAIAAVL